MPDEIEIETSAPVATAATAAEGATAGAPAPEAAGPADPPEVAALKQQVAQLQAQLEDSFARARETGARLRDEHDRLLRTAAEFENFRKRALKEKEDVQKFGIEKLLKDFFPVADNLERALDHAEQHDPKVVIEGVRLVQKMLDQAFSKHGLSSFSAVGQPFDPALHEALMQAESEQAPGTVVSEMARGYKLHERLVRPAAVVVAKAKAAPETPPSEAGPAPAPEAAAPGDAGTAGPKA